MPTARLIHVVLFVALVCPAHAQFLEPELRSISPTGGQVGTTVEISVLGERLDETERLQFSNAGIASTAKTAAGNFTVTIAPEVPPGRYDVRVVGRTGVSNPRAFLVGPLVNVIPAPTSHDAISPTPLALGTIAHGTSVAAQVDYYALNVPVAMSLRIDLIAARLDSRMIGQLQLVDAAGHVIARARGGDGVDPRLVIEDVAPGDYLIAVADFLFRGGDDYRYQLVARELSSANDLIETASREPRSFAVSRSMTLEPAAPLAKSPESIVIPHDATWLLPADRSRSVFEFEATQGVSLTIDVMSQRMDEPTDIRLAVKRIETDAAGAVTLHDVVTADDAQEITDGLLNLSTRDPRVTFAVPVTAKYRVEIRDLDTGDSLRSSQRFRLQIRLAEPSFDLAAYRLYPHKDIAQSRPHGSRLFRGGTEVIRVLAVRRDGWSGPIEVRAENLPAGVTSPSVVMAANQSQTQLTLIAGDDAPSGVSTIRVLGRSVDGAIEREAVPVAIAATKGGSREFLPLRIAAGLTVAVSEKDVSPISIRLEGAAEVKRGAALTVVAKVTRREGGIEPVTVRPRDLPAGVTAGEIAIAADAVEGNLIFTTTPATAIGSYSLWTLSETKIKLTPDAAPLTVFIPSSSITFRVIEP